MASVHEIRIKIVLVSYEKGRLPNSGIKHLILWVKVCDLPMDPYVSGML